MRRPPMDMRRMASSWGIQAGSAGANSFVSLLNDSTGAWLIALYDVQFVQAASAQFNAYFTDGPQGSLARRGSSLYRGIGAGAGSIYTGATTGIPAAWTQIWLSGNVNELGATWHHDYPFCVLRPTSSITFTNNATNATINMGLVWQWVRPEEFETIEDFE